MANYVQQANEQTLASLLQLHKADIMNSINCHQVGEIVSFNSSTQTAEVQIKMLKMINGELKEYPILIDCPCVILGGGDGVITFPISQGDSCLVLFNDKDIDNWYSGGQTMQPRTDRTHCFSDAIALVGVRNKLTQLSSYLTSGAEFKYGSSTIKLENGTITIDNGSATFKISSSSVTIQGSSVSITGDLSITGNVSITGTFTVNGKNVGDTHMHSGVTGGQGTTGGVV